MANTYNPNQATQQQPKQQLKRPNPPKADLPAPIVVEKNHALAELKSEMVGRQDFYQQITDMRIQHIDHCEAESDAAVIAHVQGKQGNNFFENSDLNALAAQFMQPSSIALVEGTDSRSAVLPSSSQVA